MKTAKTRTARYNSATLHREIIIDGQVVSVRRATNEDFDGYIYGILEQMYVERGDVISSYDTSFGDYDWSDRQDRINALNVLDSFNQERMRSGKAKITLLIEEQVL